VAETVTEQVFIEMTLAPLPATGHEKIQLLKSVDKNSVNSISGEK
jgi:hypothetical protein